MVVKQIKISQTAKEQLIKLKRKTKIQNWNVLCRWAFCRSLAEPTKPSPMHIPADSSVEMSWPVFGGSFGPLFWAALTQRCHEDGRQLSDEVLAEQFRLHLHRGISYLAGEKSLSGIEDLIALGVTGGAG